MYLELKLFLTRSLELQIVGGSFGHLCFSTMEPLEAEPSCCLELRSLHAVIQLMRSMDPSKTSFPDEWTTSLQQRNSSAPTKFMSLHSSHWHLRRQGK